MLARCHNGLMRRIESVERHFEALRLDAVKGREDQLRRWREAEGLLSFTWQAWCGFCRGVLIESCNGTITRSGVPAVGKAPGLTSGRIAYVAKAISRGDPIKPAKELASHQEPTWGDRQIVLDCARHFQVSNEGNLELGLLLETRAAEDMRIVRNAAAHLSDTGMKSVQALSAFYTGGKLRHPTDFLFWNDNETGDVAFLVWISDLIECADLMTS